MDEWRQLANCDDIVDVGLAVVRESGEVYVKGADALFSKKKATPKEASTGTAVWQTYSTAYACRYGENPVRNVTVNGQIANFVKRLGADESPHVAAFYVQHNDPYYVRNAHSVGLMLRDAEKLRTEWKTGKNVSGRRQTNAEANADAAGELWRKNQRGEL